MRIEKIYRYPVKGLSAEALEAVALMPGEMLPHDRRFALAQGMRPLMWRHRAGFPSAISAA